MFKNVGFQIHSAVAVKIHVVCDATPCDLNEDPVGEVQTYSCYCGPDWSHI